MREGERDGKNVRDFAEEIDKEKERAEWGEYIKSRYTIRGYHVYVFLRIYYLLK